MQSATTPFIGRETELDSLLQFCRGAGASSTITITGPEGIGKTRLLANLARRISDPNGFYVATPDPSGLRMPWYPILSILKQILGLEDTPTLASLSRAVAQCGLPSRDVPGLAEIFALPGPARFLELAVRRREAHASALRTLLSTERRFSGAVLCFTNTDEYDRPSQKLLRALNIAITTTSIRIITTCTELSEAPEGSESLELPPLSRDENRAAY